MATREDWAKRIERWSKSGLTARKFAEREGLEARQLYWWKWHLGSSDKPTRADDTPCFLPVRIVPSRPVAPRETPPIEIVLANGRVVRVAPGVDPSTLKTVLAIAEEDTPC